MGERTLVLFDDRRARDWHPFSLTRPVGELRFGTKTLRRRAEDVFAARCAGHIAAPHLSDFDEPWAPSILRMAELPLDGELLLWSSRAVPSASLDAAALPRRTTILEIEGRRCGLLLSGGQPGPGEAVGTAAGRYAPDPAFILDPEDVPSDLPVLSIEGTILDDVWELVLASAARLEADILERSRGRDVVPPLPAGVDRLGDAPLLLGDGVDIEPGVLLDLRDGPIWLESGVRVRAFTRLAGPSHVAEGSSVLGGSIAGTAIGPVCKVRGEVEESVFLGYGNKAHDGFLGHAYVGMWANLGAGTTNSDLKNNYGTVRLWTPGGDRDTASMKVGAFLGDHARTAIGTMLNTGTVIGAGANLFGTGMPPKYVAPFSWGFGDGNAAAPAYDRDRFLEVAERVMLRRDVALTAKQRNLLAAAWETGRAAPHGAGGGAGADPAS